MSRFLKFLGDEKKTSKQTLAEIREKHERRQIKEQRARREEPPEINTLGLSVKLPDTAFTDEQKYLLYEKHDIIGGFTDLIVDAMISIALEVKAKRSIIDPNAKVRESTKKRMKIVDDFMSDPNPTDEGIINIRKKTLVDLLVLGRAALEESFFLESSEMGLLPTGDIGALYNLPSKTIYKVTDKRGNPDSKFPYVQMFQGKVTAKFRQREIIWMELRPLSHKLYGGGPIDKFSESVLDLLALERHNRKSAQNDNIPSGILTIVNAGAKQIKSLKDYFKMLAKGKMSVSKMAVTNRSTEWTKMSDTNVDMQYIENLKWLFQKGMIVYHLQPFILGLLDISTGKSSAQAQVQAFKDYCLQPIAELESYHYTQGICKNGFGFNDVILTHPSIENVDRVTQSAINRTDVQQGLRTINEVRAEMGLSAVAWGNKPFSMLPGATAAGQNSGDSVQDPQNPTEQSKDYVLGARIEQKLFDIMEEIKKFNDD
tara:strand:- start:27994 stop:29448 length:1455 start_codon:yes stop_codon:yes gene_type:complete